MAKRAERVLSAPRSAARWVRASRLLASATALASLAVLAVSLRGQTWSATGRSVDVGPMEAAVVAALGGAMLCAHSAGRAMAVLRLVLVSVAAATLAGVALAGEPVVATDVTLLLTAAAVAAVGSRQLATRVAQPAALGVVALSVAALVNSTGLLVGGGEVLRLAPLLAVATLALGISAFGARPRWGAMAAVTADGAVGRVTRRLVVGAVVLPAAVGGASVWATGIAGVPGDSSAVAIALTVALAGIGSAVAATALASAEIRARAAEVEVRTVGEIAAEARPLQDALRSDLRPRMSTPPGWELGWRHEPATGQLAGDWLDIVDGEDGRRFLVLVDVAGHGAGPALVASWCKHQIVSALGNGATAGDALAAVEGLFLGAGQIATAVVVLLGDSIELASAGHPAVHVIGRKGVEKLPATAPPLGVGTAGFPVRRRQFIDGETLVVVSDGVPEARDGAGIEWGLESLADVALGRIAESPDDIAEALIDGARSHAGGRFADDASVVVLRRG
jgi:hypothetical protein